MHFHIHSWKSNPRYYDPRYLLPCHTIFVNIKVVLVQNKESNSTNDNKKTRVSHMTYLWSIINTIPAQYSVMNHFVWCSNNGANIIYFQSIHHAWVWVLVETETQNLGSLSSFNLLDWSVDLKVLVVFTYQINCPRCALSCTWQLY